jgi:hypothetical protein
MERTFQRSSLVQELAQRVARMHEVAFDAFTYSRELCFGSFGAFFESFRSANFDA